MDRGRLKQDEKVEAPNWDILVARVEEFQEQVYDEVLPCIEEPK